MAEIINLRQARKRKTRKIREKTAVQNRAASGRTKAEIKQAQAETRNARHALDGHLRQIDPGSGKDAGS